mmetsp:Transcript_1045/g.1472  ORF Transcript_1045/g.1472 Transcript_1045/m.1472 type:complete len:203 (+) Transcript_1045:52-660(+)
MRRDQSGSLGARNLCICSSAVALPLPRPAPSWRVPYLVALPSITAPATTKRTQTASPLSMSIASAPPLTQPATPSPRSRHLSPSAHPLLPGLGAPPTRRTRTVSPLTKPRTCALFRSLRGGLRAPWLRAWSRGCCRRLACHGCTATASSTQRIGNVTYTGWLTSACFVLALRPVWPLLALVCLTLMTSWRATQSSMITVTPL